MQSLQMLLLHSLSMEERVVIGTACATTWSIWFVQLVRLLLDMFEGCLATPWTSTCTINNLVVILFTVTSLDCCSRSCTLFTRFAIDTRHELRVINGVSHNGFCDVMRIPHHIGFVVCVEVFRDRSKQIILAFLLLVLPVCILIRFPFIS